MKHKNAWVAVMDSQGEAEAAIQEMRQASFEMKRISIVAKDPMLFWAMGLTFRLRLLISGIGHVVVGGHLVSSMIGGLKDVGIFGGLTALGAGLCRLGIPPSHVLEYESAVRSNKFLVVVHGTTEDVTLCHEALLTAA